MRYKCQNFSNDAVPPGKNQSKSSGFSIQAQAIRIAALGQAPNLAAERTIKRCNSGDKPMTFVTSPPPYFVAGNQRHS